MARQKNLNRELADGDKLRAPATDLVADLFDQAAQDKAFEPEIIRFLEYEDVATVVVVVVADENKTYRINGADVSHTITLPDELGLSAGWSIRFNNEIALATGDLTIAVNGGDAAIIYAPGATADGSVVAATGDIGDWGVIFFDGTNFFVQSNMTFA